MSAIPLRSHSAWISVMSAGNRPFRLTSIRARVRGEIAAWTVSASTHSVSGLMSAMTGDAPTSLTAFGVAIMVKSGTTTSSPDPTSSAISDNTSVTVPLLTTLQYFTPSHSAIIRSNRSVSSNSVSQPPLRR